MLIPSRFATAFHATCSAEDANWALERSEGTRLTLGRAAAAGLLRPNYNPEDSLVDRLELVLEPGGGLRRGWATAALSLPTQCGFPESVWSHLAASLVAVAVAQVGCATQRALHRHRGIALRRLDLDLRRPATVAPLNCSVELSARERAGTLIVDGEWTFEQGAVFAHARSRSVSIDRGEAASGDRIGDAESDTR